MERSKETVRRTAAVLTSAGILGILALRIRIRLPYVPPPNGIISKATVLHVPYYADKLFYFSFLIAALLGAWALLPLIRKLSPAAALGSSVVAATSVLLPLSPVWFPILWATSYPLFWATEKKLGLFFRKKWKWVLGGGGTVLLAYKEYFDVFNFGASLLQGVGIWFLVSFPSSCGPVIFLYLSASGVSSPFSYLPFLPAVLLLPKRFQRTLTLSFPFALLMWLTPKLWWLWGTCGLIAAVLLLFVRLPRTSTLRVNAYFVIPLIILILNAPPELFEVNQTPIEAFYQGQYSAAGELGQHMEWAERQLRGEVQGKDYFSLYGILTELPYTVGIALSRNKLKGFYLTTHLMSALDKVAFYFPVLALVENPVVSAVTVLLMRDSDIITFFPITPYRVLFAFAFFVAGVKRRWFLAGLLFSISLYFSHECAAAALVALLFHHGFKEFDWKKFVAGALPITAVVNLYLAVKGGFVAYYRNVVEYVQAISNGYAYLPYPSLSRALPLHNLQRLWMWIDSPFADPKLPTGYSYFTFPLLYALSLFSNCLQRGKKRILFSLTVFLTALYVVVLSRTDTFHRQYATLLVPVLLMMWLYRSVKNRAVFVILLLALFPMKEVVSNTAYNLQQGFAVRSSPPRAFKAKIFAKTIETIQKMDDNEIFVFCNSPAIYFYTGKKNPTRFGQISQAVYRRHRLEVYEDLVRKDVKVIVRDYLTSNSDSISDCDLFPEVCEYLKERFKEYIINPSLSIFLRDDASDKDRKLIEELGYFGPVEPLSMPEEPRLRADEMKKSGGGKYVNRCGCERKDLKNVRRNEVTLQLRPQRSSE